MRIRGKKSWALIGTKIVRFKTHADFDAWWNDELRKVAERPRSGPTYTIDEVREHLNEHAKKHEAYKRVTRRPKKKRIHRKRLWPA